MPNGDGERLPPEELLKGALDDPAAKGLVTAGAAVEPVPYAETLTVSAYELEEALDREVDRQERQSVIRLRELFSYGLGAFLGAQLLFMNGVLIAVGVHALIISPTTIRFYLTGTLGEIFGLVTVAVRFLFSDKPPLWGRSGRKGKQTK